MNRGAAKASFIEPMLLLRSGTLPEGPRWIYELKLDGYHLAIKSGGSVELRSRDNNDFTGKYPAIAKALNRPPDESVLDGEVVAFDESGRPSFNMLQNHRPGAARAAGEPSRPASRCPRLWFRGPDRQAAGQP
jgi:bifunctional non-homologous end joining protein LigD